MRELGWRPPDDDAGFAAGQPRFVFPRADALATVADDPRIAPVMLRAALAASGGGTWVNGAPVSTSGSGSTPPSDEGAQTFPLE